MPAEQAVLALHQMANQIAGTATADHKEEGHEAGGI